jgi:glycosyltransferase involved in cell wall biosynthesis
VKILHLYANHKVTGPAELAVCTARALAKRGLDVRFQSSVVELTEKRKNWLLERTEAEGVNPANLEGLRLPKHINPLRAFLDVRALKSHLRANRPDVIHCHLPGDHLVAGLAARSLGVPIVRTLYDGHPAKPTARTRRNYAKHTHTLVCHSRAVADVLRAKAGTYGLDPAKVVHLPPPVDTVRFDPARGLPSRRSELGVPEDAFCVGIVARMQTHRRFELLLDAVKRTRTRVPDFHLVIVGRGTNADAVARQPILDMGLEDCVHLSGYVRGDDYVATIGSFDAQVFLVPGSDGTCRAVRQGLAMGLPTLTTRRGILPELVREGTDGRNLEETAEAFAAGLTQLAQDRDELARMSTAAREGAVERFAYANLIEKLEGIYKAAVS